MIHAFSCKKKDRNSDVNIEHFFFFLHSTLLWLWNEVIYDLSAINFRINHNLIPTGKCNMDRS